jgi:hypothetical protein
MRSKHVDKFNHDQDAPGYDQDILNEAHPIRAGYGELLDWVAAALAIQQFNNQLFSAFLTHLFPPCAKSSITPEHRRSDDPGVALAHYYNDSPMYQHALAPIL